MSKEANNPDHHTSFVAIAPQSASNVAGRIVTNHDSDITELEQSVERSKEWAGSLVWQLQSLRNELSDFNVGFNNARGSELWSELDKVYRKLEKLSGTRPVAELPLLPLADECDMAYRALETSISGTHEPCTIEPLILRTPYKGPITRLRSFFSGVQLSQSDEPEWRARIHQAIDELLRSTGVLIMVSRLTPGGFVDCPEEFSRVSSDLDALGGLIKEARERPLAVEVHKMWKSFEDDMFYLSLASSNSIVWTWAPSSTRDSEPALYELSFVRDALEKFNVGFNHGVSPNETAETLKRLISGLRPPQPSLIKTGRGVYILPPSKSTGSVEFIVVPTGPDSSEAIAEYEDAIGQYAAIQDRITGPLLRGLLSSLDSPEKQAAEARYLNSQLEEVLDRALSCCNDAEAKERQLIELKEELASTLLKEAMDKSRLTASTSESIRALRQEAEASLEAASEALSFYKQLTNEVLLKLNSTPYGARLEAIGTQGCLQTQLLGLEEKESRKLIEVETVRELEEIEEFTLKALGQGAGESLIEQPVD
jgi:hypothetical protein